MKLVIPLSLILFLFACRSNKEEDIRFDPAKWKNDEQTRYLMVNDIAKNDLFSNKTKEEIIQLLGLPEEDGPCDNCIGYSTYEPAQGFSIDHQVLQINFNNQSKVIDVFTNAW